MHGVGVETRMEKRSTLAYVFLSCIVGIVFWIDLITGIDGECWGEAWPAMSAIGFWEVVSIGYVIVQWVHIKMAPPGKRRKPLSEEGEAAQGYRKMRCPA
jgi:hypothetical protein